MERFKDLPYHLAFQSRAGPVKWLEPSTDGMLRHLADHDVKNLLIVPLSFVSDHIETLYEIDQEYGQLAHELGYSACRRSPSLNTTPAFIDCLVDLVRREEA
jgi:protoporphyrin/coproporphyrin ferrochelatase